MTKPGYKTTEFWMTLVATLIGMLYASGVVAPEGTSALEKVVAFVAALLVATGYTVSRGVAKSHAP